MRLLYSLLFFVCCRGVAVPEENVEIGERRAGATGTGRVQLEGAVPRGKPAPVVRDRPFELPDRSQGGPVADQHVQLRRG